MASDVYNTLTSVFGSNMSTTRSPKLRGLSKRQTPTVSSFCSVPFCSNSRGKDQQFGVKRSYYTFPLNDKPRLKKWKEAIPRKNWSPKKSSRICSDHFVEGKKTNQPASSGYVPTIFRGADKAKGKKSPKRRATKTSMRVQETGLTASSPQQPKKMRRKLSFNPVPAVEVNDHPSTIQIEEETFVAPEIVHPSPLPIQAKRGRPKVLKPAEDPQVYPNAVWMSDHDYVKTNTCQHPVTAQERKIHEQAQEIDRLNQELDKCRAKMVSLDTIPSEDFRIWTNLPNREVFNALGVYLKSRGGENLKYWKGKNTLKNKHFTLTGFQNKPGPARALTFEEEFFLVLVKLKTGYHNMQLEHLFGISDTQISSIFTTFVNFLHIELKILFEMPDLQDGSDDGVPDVFRKYGDGLKVVLDCTEIQVQKSSDIRARKELFSNYKQRDTMKFMVGLSPNQTVNFVSKAWGGRASDKKITLNSDELLQALPPGSKVMSDKGFNLGEELKAMGVELIIPDFKGSNRSQFSRAELEHSENVAQARIHVERIIQRIRTFHILGHVTLLSMKDIMEQVFTLCAYLTNFQLPIVK